VLAQQRGIRNRWVGEQPDALDPFRILAERKACLAHGDELGPAGVAAGG